MTDLFQFLPESTKPAASPPIAAPAPAPPVEPPPPIPDRAWPGDPVASFACYCGAQDEVLEPAPVWVTCWQKGCGGQMHRWTPRNPPPSGNARGLTPEETERMKAPSP